VNQSSSTCRNDSDSLIDFDYYKDFSKLVVWPQPASGDGACFLLKRTISFAFNDGTRPGQLIRQKMYWGKRRIGGSGRLLENRRPAKIRSGFAGEKEEMVNFEKLKPCNPEYNEIRRKGGVTCVICCLRSCLSDW
jgi:hypothetical protein